MKKLLIIILLIVGCEELGWDTQQISASTAVTDTLYISYDTTFTIYDTLIINYDTTIYVYDTLVVYDTLIINNTDCAGVCHESGEHVRTSGYPNKNGDCVFVIFPGDG